MISRCCEGQLQAPPALPRPRSQKQKALLVGFLSATLILGARLDLDRGPAALFERARENGWLHGGRFLRWRALKTSNTESSTLAVYLCEVDAPSCQRD